MKFFLNTNKKSNVLWNTHSFSDIKLYPEIRLFPFHPEPLEDESLSPWMIRTVFANFTNLTLLINTIPIKSIKDLQFLIQGKIYYKIYIDLDFNRIPEIINFFIEKTGISEDNLKEMSLFDLKNEIEKYNGYYKYLWTTRWLSYNLAGL